MLRSKLCEKFLKENKVNCCTTIDSESESEFNHNGCDCCRSLACSTYETNGYAPKTKEVIELGDVCHECLCYFANGECQEEV